MKFFSYILFLLSLLAASSCGTARHTPSVTDSTRVEVRVEREFIRDTAYIELPVIIEKRATLDTASTLENKYAKSEVSVSGGVLTHSLSTKPVKEPVILQNEIVYRDSLVYRDRVVREDIYIEKELTWWQRFCLKVGSVSLILIVIAILYLILHFIHNYLNLKAL